VLQPRAPSASLVVHAVNVLELRIFLVAEARVDQDEPVWMLDEEAPHRQGNSVALVRWDATLPQAFRHHPEHCASVQAHRSALDRVAGQAADTKGGGTHSGAECRGR